VTVRPETLRALEGGRALFNAGRFYEAHEAWEAAWLTEAGEVRRLLQGLIQVAAGYLKALDHRRPAGAARLLGAGLEKLQALPEESLGLALGPFRERVAENLHEVRRWLAGEGSGLEKGAAPPLERTRLT